MKKIYMGLSLLAVLLTGWQLNAGAQTTTYPFSYTGAVQTWTVPPGVASVVVNAAGATGGLNGQTHPGCTSTCGNMADSAGNGGCVICTLAVTPGTVLDIYVGGSGANATTSVPGAGGWNGGAVGALGYVPYAGGGGGGASDIRVPPYALGNRVVVAGGGGGAGGNYFLPPVNYDKGGNGGGTTGQAGSDGGTVGGPGGGGGGSGFSGGSAGTYSGWGTAAIGTLGTGGAAATPSGGGGGGGGYYGGGGGSWGGGGGGSSYTDATLATGVTHTQGCNHGPNGYVTITVLCTPPVGGAVSGPSVYCSGASGVYTDASATAGGVWSSSNPAAGTIGATTGIFTTNPAGGVTVISYTITLSCGTASASQTVTVNPTPPPIAGNTTLCTGSISMLTDGMSGGTWTSSNPATASIGSSNGIVSGLTVGATTITYMMPAGCYVTTTVNVAGISGPHNVCVGNTVTLGASSPGGAWSSSNPVAAPIDPATGVVSGVAIGTGTISYTLPSGCTAIWSFSVDPIAPIVGRDSVCVGSNRYLTDIVGGGTWTSSILGVATVRPDSGKVTGVGAGITTISYLLPTGCLSTAAFTVIDYPTAITGTMQVCPGATTTLGNATAGGTWSSSNPAVATVNPVSGVVTGVFADTADITYTIQPGCPVSTRVVVNPLPAPVTGPAVVCPGTTDTMHDATPGGLWSSSVLPVLTIVDTNGIFSALTGGSSVIRYQLPTGCLQTKTVSVDPIPVPAIFYNYLQNTFYATPGYATYQWYDSAVGKIRGATSPTLAAPETQYYYVEVTDSNGCKGFSPYYYFNLRQVGIKNYVNNTDIRIYPNPASNIVYVSSPVKVRAIISGADGKTVINEADAQAIDVSSLPGGLYLITLFDEDGVRITVQKLVKE